MLAVSTILKKQFPNINGLQDTTNTPFFVDEKNVWNTEKQFKSQQAPCTQIHFDGNNHWTMSFATDANAIFYIDSLSDNLKELKSNIKIQLSQIYRSKSKTLHVKIPRVQQQPNSHDCGLFAIANVVEFCYSPNSFNSRTFFSVSKMRQHLIHCLENGKMTEFPKEKNKCRGNLNSYTCRVSKIPVWCHCKMPEFIDNMVCCENRKCKTWFHRNCLGISSRLEAEWQCVSCGLTNC